MKIFTKGSILILALLLFTSCNIDSLPNDLPFDSAKWKGGGLRLRGRMANDLHHSNVLNDKTKTEVENILGKPDDATNLNYWLYKVDLGGSKNPSTTAISFNINFDEKTEKAGGTFFTGGLFFGIYTILPSGTQILR